MRLLKLYQNVELKQLAKPWITKGIRTSIKQRIDYIKLEIVANINLMEIKSSLLRF